MISNFKDLNVYFKSFEDRDDNLSQIRGLAVHFLFFFLLDAVRKKYFDTLVRKHGVFFPRVIMHLHSSTKLFFSNI